MMGKPKASGLGLPRSGWAPRAPGIPSLPDVPRSVLPGGAGGTEL